MVDRLQLVRATNDLIVPEKRQDAIQNISHQLNIETFIVFIPDPETSTLLASPGFPNTLPNGCRWQEFLRECLQQSRIDASMPWPEADTLMPARGIKSPDGSVLVLLGGKPTPEDVDEIVLLLPLLTAALRSENINRMYASQANFAAVLAKQSENLAVRLDESRRATHKELVERQRADAALRLAREELQRHATQLERTVEDRTTELRETVQQLETFSYSVVHDMRAPLRSMRSFANVLAEDYGPGLDERARDYLGRIKASAGRMDALITDVLNYSRLTGGELALGRVDVDKMVRGMLQQYPEFQERAAFIHVESPLPAVIANGPLLGQCITNLLGNALKFMPPERTPKVTIRGETRNQTARLFVEDNGIGIDPEYYSKIFGLFQRLHRPDQFPGTGVGLAIVKKAVERMHGTIGVESKPQEGSRFWIDLPLTD